MQPSSPRRFSSLYPFIKSGVLVAVMAAGSAALPTSRLLAEPPTTVESQSAATAGKAVLVVSENGKTQTLESEGRDVSIDGNKNDITLRGKCHALTVSGDENTVHAEALASVSTPGNKNAVFWTQAVNGEKPQITNVGSGNSIEHSSK